MFNTLNNTFPINYLILMLLTLILSYKFYSSNSLLFFYIKEDYCEPSNMNSIPFFLTTASQNKYHTHFGDIDVASSKKWKRLMLNSLKGMQDKYQKNKNIIMDLIVIVTSVPDCSFVSTTLDMIPFKPEFKRVFPTCLASESTIDSTTVNKTKEEELGYLYWKSIGMGEKRLMGLLSKDSHPFKFIIKNFKRLMELKYKKLLDQKEIKSFSTVSSMLKTDITIFSEFIYQASHPYLHFFQCQNVEQQYEQLKEFVDGFLFEEERLNQCVRSVLIYASRSLHSRDIENKLGETLNPEDLDLDENLKIKGCYIRSMNSLIEFSNLSNPYESLQKLTEVRKSIIDDISEFHNNSVSPLTKTLLLTAENQLTIFKFIQSKLKGWACEIYAQLKYLEFVYGEDEIYYVYEESSYIFTQLSAVFEMLEL